MPNRNYYLIENRVIYSEFDSRLSIISNPYEYLRYIFSFILYSIGIALFIYCIIKNEEVFSLFDFSNTWSFILFAFCLGLAIMYVLNLVPLIFSVFKNTFFRNLFLKEELIIEEDRFIFKKYNKIKYNIPYEEVNELYLDLNKKVEEFSGVPWLVPNYKPIIHLILINNPRPIKIFQSIERNEIKYVYEAITEKLIKNGILYYESQRHKNSLNVTLTSAKEFYLANKHFFSEKEIGAIDQNINSLELRSGDFYDLVIEKFKQRVVFVRKVSNIKIY